MPKTTFESTTTVEELALRMPTWLVDRLNKSTIRSSDQFIEWVFIQSKSHGYSQPPWSAAINHDVRSYLEGVARSIGSTQVHQTPRLLTLAFIAPHIDWKKCETAYYSLD